MHAVTPASLHPPGVMQREAVSFVQAAVGSMRAFPEKRPADVAATFFWSSVSTCCIDEKIAPVVHGDASAP